jgi:hypothetical protein
MLFSEAIRGVELTAQVGPDVDVVRVDYDSRRVGPGWIFLAMRGGRSTGTGSFLQPSSEVPPLL